MAHELITKTPGIVGGSARIVDTRIPVWVLADRSRCGWTSTEILDNYPTIKKLHLEAALDYARAHSDEITAEIAAHNAFFNE